MGFSTAKICLKWVQVMLEATLKEKIDCQVMDDYKGHFR
jgi:hypothetical protein